MKVSEELRAVQIRIQQIERWTPDLDAPASSSIFSRLVQNSSGNYGGPSPKRFVNVIERASKAWNVDAALIRAVIANESGFNPSATSAAGAQGLMQLMPQTAAELGVSNPYDPEENIFAGARYLRGLLDRFGNDRRLAVAAYNAGPQAVSKYGGIPPYAETQSYVRRVLSDYERYSLKE